MTDNLTDLRKRIADLKADALPAPESPPPESSEDKQGLGAAYELIMTPIVCGGIGVGLDKLFSTSPLCFIGLGFLGLLAGFWRIYKADQNIVTPLDLKRLQDNQKKGRNTQLSENNTEQS